MRAKAKRPPLRKRTREKARKKEKKLTLSCLSASSLAVCTALKKSHPADGRPVSANSARMGVYSGLEGGKTPKMAFLLTNSKTEPTAAMATSAEATRKTAKGGPEGPSPAARAASSRSRRTQGSSLGSCVCGGI